jgi:hypothetical protein
VQLEEMLDLLEGVRPAGNGYVGICPVHDDREASLGVTESDTGLLVKCYAGCSTEDVMTALGKKMSDLFFDAVNHSEPEAIYSYVNEEGVELFQAVRFPGKKFRQRHRTWHENGEDGYFDPEEPWIWNLDGVRRVLYRLPEVLDAVITGTTVYVTEGEKDAERLLGLGKVATCNPMGAGKWRPEYADALAGASCVIIIADRDEPGRAHADTIKESLQGRVGSVFVFQAARGKDVSDHLDAGLPIEGLQPLKKRVRRGLITAREMAEQALEDLELREVDLPGLVLVEPAPLVWRLGRMYAVGAYTGDGKTSFAQQGTRKLCSEGKRGVYFSLEMPERDLRNRFLTHRGIPLSLLEEPWRLRMDAVMYQAYLDGIEELGGWNLDIDFDSNMNAKHIADVVRDREAEFAVVDHVHRFSWGERRRFEEEVRTLTNVALEQNIMLVLLCQLRKHMRGKELETFPRPTLQDFRETSQVGDDASMALAIWRQRNSDGLSYTGATQVIVLKNRHTTGPGDSAGRIFLPKFDVTRQLFVNGGIGVQQAA